MAYVGGAERDRTADLVNAIHALSQLSYGPVQVAAGMGSRGPGYLCAGIGKCKRRGGSFGSPMRETPEQPV